ncbi:MAG: three-Cys-motif partner protein TcmP [Gemmatimonadota bacterium]
MSERRTEDFFKAPKDWAKYKHRILGSYLRIWVYKLSSSHDRLVFVDTCAGAGTYENGKPGSPLIAASYNDSYLRDKGKSLLVIACEKSKSNARKLSASLAPYAERRPAEAVVINDNYIGRLEEITGVTRGVPTLFFIDPYGMADLTAENLAPLLGDHARESTEVLVRVPATLLSRFAGWLRKREHTDRTAKTAESFRHLLERLDIDEQLLAQAAEAEDVSELPSYMDLMDSYLQLFTRRFRYVTPLPVRQNYFSPPKYFLVHGTDSPHGLVHMNDVLSTTEDVVFKDTADALAGSQTLLFAPERQLRASIADAAKEVEKAVRRHAGGAVWIDVRSELVLKFGDDLREKHHNAALKMLLEDGRVRLIGAKTRNPLYRKYTPR